MEQMHRWHQTKSGLTIFFVIELGLVYLFTSLAIDRGDLWFYLLTLLFLVGSIQDIVHLIEKVVHRA